MKKISHVLLLIGLVSLAGSVRAQEVIKDMPAAKKLDITAEQVLEKFIEATGGRQAREKMTSSVVKGTLEIPAQGIKGAIEIYAKAPNKLLVVQSISGIGEIKQGYDGQVGWTQNPFQGTRDLEGVELAAFKREANFNSELKWRELYEKVELVGTDKVGDQEAYVIRLTPSVGQPLTQYYDSQTFLLLRIDGVQEGPQGTVPVQTYLSDYREVEGVKVAFQATQKIPIGEAVIKLTELKSNVEIEDAKFAKPAAK
jgi:hypothetical protein